MNSTLQAFRDGAWVTTHTLLFALGSGALPDPVPWGTDVAIPAIGLLAGPTRQARLPVVEPGRYRILHAGRIAPIWITAPGAGCAPDTGCTHA